MKCPPLLSLTLASTVLVAAGCKKEPVQATADKPVAAVAGGANASTDPNEVVASVNGIQFLRKDMEESAAAQIKAQGQNIAPEQMDEARRYFEQQVVRGFIMKTLLIGEAKKQNIAITDEICQKQIAQVEEMIKAQQSKTLDQYFKESPLGEKKAREDFEENMLIQGLITKAVLDTIVIDKAEIDKIIEDVTKRNEEAAEKNKSLDTANAAAKKKIEDIKKQLDGGADFAELAKNNSDCPSGQNGGDLGQFTRGQMVKPFEDAAFTQEPGKVGEIVETQFGYHLIKVTAKSPAVAAQGDTPAAPESVKASHILVKIEQAQQLQPVPSAEQVEAWLKQNKSSEPVQTYIQGLKSAAKIETIFPDMQF